MNENLTSCPVTAVGTFRRVGFIWHNSIRERNRHIIELAQDIEAASAVIDDDSQPSPDFRRMLLTGIALTVLAQVMLQCVRPAKKEAA